MVTFCQLCRPDKCSACRGRTAPTGGGGGIYAGAEVAGSWSSVVRRTGLISVDAELPGAVPRFVASSWWARPAGDDAFGGTSFGRRPQWSSSPAAGRIGRRQPPSDPGARVAAWSAGNHWASNDRYGEEQRPLRAPEATMIARRLAQQQRDPTAVPGRDRSRGPGWPRPRKSLLLHRRPPAGRGSVEPDAVGDAFECGLRRVPFRHPGELRRLGQPDRWRHRRAGRPTRLVSPGPDRRSALSAAGPDRHRGNTAAFPRCRWNGPDWLPPERLGGADPGRPEQALNAGGPEGGLTAGAVAAGDGAAGAESLPERSPPERSLPWREVPLSCCRGSLMGGARCRCRGRVACVDLRRRWWLLREGAAS